MRESRLFLILADCTFAQGMAFGFQGRVQSGNNFASGSFDLSFKSHARS
jgi:hypothetical protein